MGKDAPISTSDSQTAPVDSRPALPFHLVLRGCLLILLAAGAAWYAYYRLFSTFAPYDDEGTLMLRIRMFIEGQPLYDAVPSVYGPFYFIFKWVVHSVAGAPVTNDFTRLCTLGCWLAASLCSFALTHRMTKSFVLAGLVFLQTTVHLDSLRNEPGHPQELVVVLIPLALLAATWFRPGGGNRVCAIVLGLLAGALVLVKVNVGAFLILPILWSLGLLAERTRLLKLGLFLACVCSAILPAVIMRRLALPGEVAFHYGAVTTLATLSLLLVGLAHRGPARAGLRLFLWFGAALALCVLVTCGIVTARGSTLAGLLDGIVLRAATVFSESMGVGPARIHALGLVNGVLAALLALFHVAARRSEGRMKTVEGRLLFCGKLLFGLSVFAASMARKHHFMIGFHLPYLWLLLVPPPGGEKGPTHRSFTLPLLAMTAVLQALQAFPVSGSQRAWATFLLLPAGAVLFADSFSVLRDRAAKNLMPLRAPRHRAIAATLTLVAAMAAYLVWKDLPGMKATYDANVSMGLPGAERIRPDSDAIAGLQFPSRRGESLGENADALGIECVAINNWLTNNLRAHADTFVTLPGLNSLYVWTGREPPPGFASSAWMALLTADEQRTIVRGLARTQRVCAVVNPRGIAFWGAKDAIAQAPLATFILRRFRPVYTFGDYMFCIRDDRDPRDVFNALLSGQRSFSGPEAVLPLPKGILLGPSARTLSLWFRTGSPGVILGAQERPYPRESGSGSPILSIGSDGKLRARFPGGGAASFATEAALNDDLWHHVALVTDGGRLFLYIDGSPCGEAPLVLGDEELPYAQFGAGLNAEGPQTGKAWSLFQGTLRDAARYDRSLEAHEIGALYRSGLR